MTAAARFVQVNLVVSDMDAATAFYELLGLDMNTPAEDWPAGSGARHGNAREGSAEGDFDVDNVPMARIWGDDGLEPGETVLGFRLPTREAVDEKYRELTGAGYKGRREPYDAFFGARYAMVDDPDGHPIGLMSPRDRERNYVPEPK